MQEIFYQIHGARVIRIISDLPDPAEAAARLWQATARRRLHRVIRKVHSPAHSAQRRRVY